MFRCLPVVQRRELEYDKHLRDKMIVAKNEFRALLRETKMITYRLVPGHSVWSHSQIVGGWRTVASFRPHSVCVLPPVQRVLKVTINCTEGLSIANEFGDVHLCSFCNK